MIVMLQFFILDGSLSLNDTSVGILDLDAMQGQPITLSNIRCDHLCCVAGYVSSACFF